MGKILLKTDISLQEDERTLSGRILEVEFLDGAERGDCKAYYSKDRNFSLCSVSSPTFPGEELFVWGYDKELDNKEVFYTYDSKEEALKALAYINEFSIEEPITVETSLPNELEINGITYIRK